MSEIPEDVVRAALSELVDFIKIHKVSVLTGMTGREAGFLLEALHNANVALATPRPPAEGESA